ncbi:MAG: ATP-binding protein [Clostridia bacterium]|nr:ATP-binding protein [Clostridia bacterium]
MKEITVKAAIANMPLVIGLAEEVLEQAGCSMRVQMQIDVAIDELFGNVAHYAYPDGEGDAIIQCGVDPETRVFTFVLKDRGIPFNPLDRPEPDVTLPAKDRKIGGLGIFLAKKTMDELTYRWEDGFNILTAQKKI